MLHLTKSMCIGLLVGVALGLIGFFVGVHGGREMGTSLFIAVPFGTGFAIALVTRPKEGLLSVLLLTLIICLAFLFFTQLEGWLCCILSCPVLLISMSIGAGFGILLRSKTSILPYDRSLRIFLLLMLPLTLQAADALERPYILKGREESFTDSIIIKASAEKVWKQLVSVDHITVAKPWLMYVGLYEPVRCTISAEHVGAVRTCYFTKGAIYELVDGWNPPRSMHLIITNSTLPGRPWMGYVDASYKLIAIGENTRLERTTTITSRLAPAWYWRRFEKMGVQAEHAYLFAEIKKRSEAVD